MSQNYYDLYLNAVIELAETLVVKSEYSALRLNQHMLMTYGASSYDEHDPRTWKYYLNISGEYHARDEEMQITSLDTLQTIVFSKANLSVHTATARAYQYGTRYYRELVTRFPGQEQLILGILYPADIDRAIAAKDFAVLAYPPHLVEDNEVSLIKDIDEWCRLYAGRWNNRQFVHSDDLYGMALLSELYGYLPCLIWNLRLRACRTNEAHSFHVRQYLASHGMLDQYMNHLTHEQTLFFYRNINWIERNAGRQETFDWLVEKVMTLRGLPLSAYTMHHDAGRMPDRLTADVTFKKTLLNPGTRNLDKAVNFYTLDEVLDKEDPLAIGNPEFRKFNQQQMLELFQNSLSNVVTTKVLESSVIDFTDAVPYTLHSILLNHWIYMSQKGLYNVYVQTKNPRTGEYFSLHVREAYVYFIYAFCKAMGITLTTVPKLLTLRIQRTPMPSLEDLLSVVDTKYVTPAMGAMVRATQPPMNAVSSVTGFRDHCLGLHQAADLQNSMIALQEHMYTRGLLHGFVSRMYSDELLPSPAPNKPYTTWFAEQNFPYEGFSTEDWTDVYLDLYEQCTGYKMTVTESIANMQKAMVRIMEQLSSYSVQFVSEINGSAIKVMNWAAVRVGDMRGMGLLYYQVILAMMRTINRNSYGYSRHRIELGPLIQQAQFAQQQIDLGHWEIPVKPIGVSFDQEIFGRLSPMQFDLSYLPEQSTHLTFQSPLTAPYYAMTQEERSQIPSGYGQCFPDVVYPDKVDIGDFVLTGDLPGLVHLRPRVNYLNAFQYYYVPSHSYQFMNLNTEVTLNAFYPNYGDVETGLHLNHGGVTANSFKYTLDIPLETHLQNAEAYSGGWSYLTQFDPALATDIETTLTGFATGVYAQKTYTFIPTYGAYTATDWFFSGYGNATLHPFNSVGKSEQRYTSVSDRRTITILGLAPVYTANLFASNHSATMSALHQTHDTRNAGTLKSTQDARTVTITGHPYLYRTMFFRNTAVVRSLPSNWRVISHHRTLEDFTYIRDSRTVPAFLRTTVTRSLPKFRLIMATRSLSAFGLLVGGPTTLQTKGAHEKLTRQFFNATDIRTIVLTL